MLLLIPLLAIAELVVIFQVAHAIGWLDTLALLILVSVAGGWLVKRVGLAVVRRVQEQLEAHRTPHRELLDGLLVLAAGILLVVPGFITAACGLVLLLPPVRAVISSRVARRLERRLASGHSYARRGFIVFASRERVIDTGGTETSDADQGRWDRPRGAIESRSVAGRHGRS